MIRYAVVAQRLHRREWSQNVNTLVLQPTVYMIHYAAMTQKNKKQYDCRYLQDCLFIRTRSNVKCEHATTQHGVYLTWHAWLRADFCLSFNGPPWWSKPFASSQVRLSHLHFSKTTSSSSSLVILCIGFRYLHFHSFFSSLHLNPWIIFPHP